MDVLVFSDAKDTKTLFSKIGKSKLFALKFLPCSELKKTIKNAPKGTLIYYDVTGNSETEINKIVKYLSGLKNYQFGIIDPKGTYRDIAALFHNEASDYIGKLLPKAQLTDRRLQKAITFGVETLSRGIGEEEKETKPEYILSGNDWKNIKSGNEYTFTIVFIELDNMNALKKIAGAEHLNTLMKRFRDYISSATAQINGRIWMSKDAGWVVLLPFDGTRCNAILTCFRLMLDRAIISAEDIAYNTLLSYRIALHIGNTVYRKMGDTGNIVSDSINSIFHLGQKYAEPGNFYVTQDVVPFIPQGLIEYFVPAGIYEGRRIMRMRTIK
jgi:class 3 adenylate cyclase